MNELFNDLDGILIYNEGEPIVDLNFFYFTRLLDSGLFEGSYLFMTEEKKIIITSQLEETSARKSGMDVKIFTKSEEKENILREIVGNRKRIGISFSTISKKEYDHLKNLLKDVEFVDVDERIAKMRMVKDQEEIKIIKEACKIASDVAEDIVNYIKEGMREYELAAELTHLLLKNGAQDNAFTPIIAFGENSAEPHYFSGSRKLKKGDIVLMDFGAKYRKYNSDMTRTYVFGRADEKIKRMYDVVLEAQKIGINSIKKGVKGSDVDKNVRDFIDSTEFKGLFIHSTGHGVGLAVHDHAALSQYSNIVLENGMVVTVEPGVYIKNFGGIRIEDDVLVDGEGVVLTHAKKDLIEI